MSDTCHLAGQTGKKSSGKLIASRGMLRGAIKGFVMIQRMVVVGRILSEKQTGYRRLSYVNLTTCAVLLFATEKERNSLLGT